HISLETLIRSVGASASRFYYDFCQPTKGYLYATVFHKLNSSKILSNSASQSCRKLPSLTMPACIGYYIVLMIFFFYGRNLTFVKNTAQKLNISQTVLNRTSAVYSNFTFYILHFTFFLHPSSTSTSASLLTPTRSFSSPPSPRAAHCRIRAWMRECAKNNNKKLRDVLSAHHLSYFNSRLTRGTHTDRQTDSTYYTFTYSWPVVRTDGSSRFSSVKCCIISCYLPPTSHGMAKSGKGRTECLPLPSHSNLSFRFRVSFSNSPSFNFYLCHYKISSHYILHYDGCMLSLLKVQKIRPLLPEQIAKSCGIHSFIEKINLKTPFQNPLWPTLAQNYPEKHCALTAFISGGLGCSTFHKRLRNGAEMCPYCRGTTPNTYSKLSASLALDSASLESRFLSVFIWPGKNEKEEGTET
ncbi:Hypothetical predicted protein, partial [Drosophila guanche]